MFSGLYLYQAGFSLRPSRESRQRAAVATFEYTDVQEQALEVELERGAQDGFH